MNDRKEKYYSISVDPERVDEMTDGQYAQLRADALSICETPEEYGDYVYVMPARNAAGEQVWLGFK